MGAVEAVALGLAPVDRLAVADGVGEPLRDAGEAPEGLAPEESVGEGDAPTASEGGGRWRGRAAEGGGGGRL